MFAHTQIKRFSALQVSQFLHVLLALGSEIDIMGWICGISHQFIDGGNDIVINADVSLDVDQPGQFHITETFAFDRGIVFNKEVVTLIKETIKNFDHLSVILCRPFELLQQHSAFAISVIRSFACSPIVR